MKKIFVLVFLSASLLLSAAGNAVSRNEVMANVQKVSMANSFGSVMNVGERSYVMMDASDVRAPQAVDGTDFYYVPGMLHYGMSEDYMAYGLSAIIIPFTDTCVWHNIYGPATWLQETQQGTIIGAENSTVYGNRYGCNGWYYLPEIQAHNYASKEGNLSIAGYKYAETEESRYLMSGDNSEYSQHMTLCEMYCPASMNPSGNDMYRIGAGSYGEYAYGTKLNVGEGSDIQYADTIGVLMLNQGKMHINQINFMVYSGAATFDQMFPVNAELTVNVYSVTEHITGEISINKDDLIATTTITKEDVVETEASILLAGLQAKFYAEDIWGLLVPTALDIEGAFFVELTGYNESNCNFGIFADYYCQNPQATTLFEVNGNLTPLWSNNSNLLVVFDGFFAALDEDYHTNEMVVPQVGGQAVDVRDPENGWLYMFTNMDPETLNFYVEDENGEEVEWLALGGFEDEDYEDYSVLYMAFGAIDEQGPIYNDGPERVAYIHLYNEEAPGFEYIIKVTQEGNNTAIENNNAAVKADKFIRNGQLVIRRGEKEFNAVGVQF